MAIRTRRPKRIKFFTLSKKNNINLPERNKFLLFHREDLFFKLKDLRKKSKISWLMDLENFSFKFLTLQGIITPIFGTFVFLNPMLGLIGTALSVAFSIPYGIYFTIKDSAQRRLEEKTRIKRIHRLLQEDTLLDYLFSDEFENFFRELGEQNEEVLKKVNERLRTFDLCKDNLDDIINIENLRNKIINAYIIKRDTQQKNSIRIADEFYTKKARYLHNTVAHTSIGPAYATLITSLLFSSLAVGGVGMSAVLMGGMSVASIMLGLAIASIVAIFVCYAQMKKDQHMHKYHEAFFYLENQHRAVKYLRDEVSFIHNEICQLTREEKSDNGSMLSFNKIFTPPPQGKTNVAYRRNTMPNIFQNERQYNLNVFS